MKEDWSLDERQRNSLRFFEEHAGEWRERAENDGKKKVSTILQRNEHAIEIAKSNLQKIKNSLDLGCGTGELVLALGKLGITGFGIDYAEGMVKLANEKATRLELGENCKFDVGSVMDYNFNDSTYDLITAFGFIEYLDPGELPQFFSICKKMMSDNGILQVGSRNRLFNMLSLNQFTQAEIGAGTTNKLLNEAITLASVGSLDEFIDSVVNDNNTSDVLKEYPQTDVAVAGYQYSPSEIIHLLDKAGFSIKSLSPVHFHALVPVMARENTELHAQFSNTIHNGFRDEYRLVPQSSTFIITAE